MENMKKECEKISFFYNKKEQSFFQKDRKGQITLFIIIAIVIVALGILIYLFYPKISAIFGGGQEQDPNAFIQNCMEDEIKSKVENLSAQGGSLNPEFYILYEDDKIQYLCYTEEYYKTCVVQKPLLARQIEKEIEKAIEPKVKSCFNELKTSFEGQKYQVNIIEGPTNVALIPQKVVSTFNYSVTLTKSETKKYDSFNIVVNNNLYELIGITDSIIDWESTYGDTDINLYMDLYHNLKIEKRKPDYGTSVYILTDKNTQNKFQFASRSLVFPPGYGTDLV